MILPEFGYGGAEKSFCALSVELSKKFNITIIVFNTISDAAYSTGGNIRSLNVLASNNVINKFLNFVKRVLRLRSIKKEIRPDVSISFLEGADYINILSKQKEKVILSIRGSKYKDEHIKGLLGFVRLNILMPFLYKKADAIITVNNGIKKEMNQLVSSNKITTIYNGYNFNQLNKSADEELPEPFKKIVGESFIIAIGRLSPEKGFQHLLKVYKKVKLVNKEVKLVVLGDGNMGEELINLCKQLNLTYDAVALGFEKINNADVVFLGYIKNPLPILKKASLFTLCSSAEGFPNALVEAMALEIPVISTDCPYGPDEILNKKGLKREKGKVLKTEFGILAPPFKEENSIGEWANVIIELLHNNKILNQYGHLGYERAREFTSQELISKWESVILN